DVRLKGARAGVGSPALEGVGQRMAIVRTTLAVLELATALTRRGSFCRSTAGRVRMGTVLVRPAPVVKGVGRSAMVRLPAFALSVSLPLQGWPGWPLQVSFTRSVPRTIRVRVVAIRIAAGVATGRGCGCVDGWAGGSAAGWVCGVGVGVSIG